MRRLSLLAATLALAAGLALGWAGSARADGYLGLYAGGSIAPDTDVKNNVDQVIDRASQFDAGPLAGIKLGHYMDTHPWLGGEINVWGAWPNRQVNDQDLTLVNFSGSLLLQAVIRPLRLYAGGGVLGTWAKLRDGATDHDAAIGAMAQGGAEFTFLPCYAVFAEYRYSWNRFHFGAADEKFELSRHELLGGINLHF